jgi:transcriptional regulator with XRE-family HTH domain
MEATEFGRKLEELQARRGMNNKELAERLGITPSGVSILKRSKKPHSTTIKRLSDIFDVDAALFLVCD